MTDPQNENTDQPTQGNKETAPSVDLSALQDALMAEFDKRFSGVQSLLDRRTSEFQSQLEELRTADLSPEDREEVLARKAQEEVERLKRENELLRLRKDFPEEVDLLSDFMEKSSLQEQLALLSGFRKAKAEEQAQGEPPQGQPTPVDKNNPPRRQEVSLADMAGEMTNELADSILGQAKEKGLLRRLRGG